MKARVPWTTGGRKQLPKPSPEEGDDWLHSPYSFAFAGKTSFPFFLAVLFFVLTSRGTRDTVGSLPVHWWGYFNWRPEIERIV